MEQKMIVVVTMCLHNFILENLALDKDFHRCNRDPDYVPTIPRRFRRQVPPQNVSNTSTSHANDRTMHRFLDDLARAITLSRA
jgi:hypothetical protein